MIKKHKINHGNPMWLKESIDFNGGKIAEEIHKKEVNAYVFDEAGCCRSLHKNFKHWRVTNNE